MYRILVTDDHELIRETLGKTLRDEGYEVSLAADGEACLRSVQEEETDLVLLDMRLPGMSGIEVLRKLRETNPELVIIIMTAYGDLESVRTALGLGAFDFIHKPVKARAIASIIKMALEIRSLRQEIQQIIYDNKERYGYHNIIGRSEALQKVLEVLARVATSDASTILLEGASGTGKGLIAKCLHYNSIRAYQPFIEINCASIPASLLESELFGHEAGAFTDAKRLKKGLVELANRGTVFLDEIGEMSPALQAKVLQVIEEKSFRRIGGERSIEVDVRIIAATNKDLKKAISEGAFRPDLYYRLNVINIRLPSLRERKEDIILLAEHFISRFSRELHRPPKIISQGARVILEDYEWPGNIRELLNIIERIMILEDAVELLPSHLPLEISRGRIASARPAPVSAMAPDGTCDYAQSTRDFQTYLIKDALERSGGNKSAAARLLGLTRLGLYHQMKKLGLLEK